MMSAEELQKLLKKPLIVLIIALLLSAVLIRLLLCVMHTYAQYMRPTCAYCQTVHITRTKTKITCTQDQMDMMSHMPKTFGICVTCAPRLQKYFFCMNKH